MILSRQLSYEVALIAILCTVALFFFPAVQGPYSAVHGPVSALLSLKAKLSLCLTLFLAAMYLLVRRVTVCVLALLPPGAGPFLPGSSHSEHTSVLRC